MKSLKCVLFFLISICIVSCGQEQQSQVKADEVLVKLPLFLSMKFDTVDVVAFSKGEDNTKFGKELISWIAYQACQLRKRTSSQL